MEGTLKPNATMTRFGYPETLVAEGAHWAVLLRPQAVTLGSLVLAATSEAIAYAQLPDAAFIEQGKLITRIEKTLLSFCRFEKINYLMMMMVDPHVHFHVIPRYNGVRAFAGVDYPDDGWPGMPASGTARALDKSTRKAMVVALRAAWRE